MVEIVGVALVGDEVAGPAEGTGNKDGDDVSNSGLSAADGGMIG